MKPCKQTRNWNEWQHRNTAKSK